MNPLITKVLSLVGGKGDGSLIEKIGEAVDNNFTSKREIEEKAMEIALEERKLEQELLLGQIEINKIEANHKSVFVAGWRPFIGWVCGGVLAINYMLIPLACTVIETWSINAVCPAPFDASNIYPIILGMLGMGGMRSFDKFKKVETNKI
jgi:hypothetical protein